MEFEWDEAKSEACFMERGFDFAYAIRAFIDPDRVVRADTRWNYGEDRYQLLGGIEGRIFSWCIPCVLRLFGSYPHARQTAGRFRTMKMQGVKIDPAILSTLPQGRVDEDRLDATREQDIKRQQRADDAQSMQDAARFARRVRKRLGLTQAEFSKRVDEPINTIRSWEQGKRCPTGAAKALLKLLDKIPEKALAALD